MAKWQDEDHDKEHGSEPYSPDEIRAWHDQVGIKGYGLPQPDRPYIRSNPLLPILDAKKDRYSRVRH